MNVDDMFQNDNPSEWTDEQITSMWPQARGELLGFANALERGKAGITAAQLRMTIWLADRGLKERQK